jgi:hypothetical protein
VAWPTRAGYARSVIDPDEERVFIFIRLRIGERVLARTKIRELGGLGTLLADFLRTSVADGIDIRPGELPPGAAPVMEYVDANTDRALIAFRVDTERQEQVIEGQIPAAYRRRMLDPEVSSFSSDRFVERAAPGLPSEQKERLAEFVRSRVDLLGRIKEAMDGDGRFEVHVPLQDGA